MAKTINRFEVEDRLSEYIAVLETAAAEWPASYASHSQLGKGLHARWIGGESAFRLKEALDVEVKLMLSEILPGRVAEDVGRSLRSLCDAVAMLD